MDKGYISACVIEVVGISVTSIGVIHEYMSGETVGLIMITIGSVIIATGSLLYAKVYTQLKDKK